MKIAFAHYSEANDISGVTTWAENILLYLHKQGHELSVLLIHIGGEMEKARLYHVLRQYGISVEIDRKARSFWEDIERTIVFLNKAKPDVFIPNCLKPFYVAASMAGKKGLPWVLTIHSDDPYYWSVVKLTKPSENNGVIVSVSAYIHDKARQSDGQARLEVIPYGVKLPDMQATFSQRPFRVVYSGRLVEEQKRISLVLRAMMALCKEQHEVECIFLGDGDQMNTLKAEVNQNQLADRILFKGHMTTDKVKVELESAQVIVLMSDFEGLPISLLEAMACGVVPVVRSIQSGIPELVIHEETGLLVNSDSSEFVKGVRLLINSPTEWQQYSNNAKKLVHDKYSESKSFDKWNDLVCSFKNHRPIKFLAKLPWLYKPYAGAFYKRVIYLRARKKIKEVRESLTRHVNVRKAK